MARVTNSSQSHGKPFDRPFKKEGSSVAMETWCTWSRFFAWIENTLYYLLQQSIHSLPNKFTWKLTFMWLLEEYRPKALGSGDRCLLNVGELLSSTAELLLQVPRNVRLLLHIVGLVVVVVVFLESPKSYILCKICEAPRSLRLPRLNQYFLDKLCFMCCCNK